MTPDTRTVSALFMNAFGIAPTVCAVAPARVEVVGNHTDYNEGYVLSAAIDRYLTVAIAPAPAGSSFKFASSQMMGIIEVAEVLPQPNHAWVNYPLGVYHFMQEKGHAVQPFFMAVASDIPMGAGLSSSAALEVATGLALAHLFGCTVSKNEMARICQKAEHEYCGTKCGLLDQFSVLFGKEGHVLFTEFRNLTCETVAVKASGLTLAITPSGVTHSLVTSAYNDRRRECFEAAAYFANKDASVTTLRDITSEQLIANKSNLSPNAFKRALHVVGEDERVLAGVKLLRSGSIAEFGKLLWESHESSRLNFENSCPELDILVDIAKTIDGVYGARLTGGGFGGATLSLIEQSASEKFAATLCSAYEEQTGIKTTVHFTAIADGAHVVV